MEQQGQTVMTDRLRFTDVISGFFFLPIKRNTFKIQTLARARWWGVSEHS